MVARLADLVARDDLVVLRLSPALASVATVVLGSLVVRELGGSRRAQLLGAGALAGGAFVLGAGHLLSTATFDLTAWMAVLWLVARLLRTGDARWWVVIGAVAGMAMLNKNLIVLLLVGVVVAMLVERRGDLLVTRWVLVGGVITIAIAAPHLVWQATNEWPQIEMARALSDRLGGENRAMLVPQQVLLVGPALVPLWWWGIRWLGRDPAGRRFRPLLWAWPIELAAVFATGGRPFGLPPAYSAHNGYYNFRRPADDEATVVAVRYRPETLAPYFDTCTQVATIDNGRDIDNEAQATPVVICHRLRTTWSHTWPHLRHVS